jgi:hypothetical protein
MWTDEEKREVMDALRRIENTVSELDDAVFGDDRQGREGLVKDMKVVHAFILKWEKREYTVRAFFILMTSNLIITLLTLIFTFVIGGNGG